MRLSLFFRDVLTGLLQPVADELQQMIGSINAWSNVEHNENGRHQAITATDLVVTQLRFPIGQSAARGHVVIVDDKAYGRPTLDFGDATNSTGTTGYGSGFGYDNLPKGRIWVDSTSTSGGTTMYLGTTNAAASGITNAGLRITPSGGSVHRNGTNTTTAYQFTQADGTVIANIDSTNLRFGVGTVSPSEKVEILSDTLHSVGFGTVTAGKVAVLGWLNTAAAPVPGLFSNSASFRLALGTNKSEQVTISTAGDVGIGTTGPAQKLDVFTSTNKDGISIGAASASAEASTNIYIKPSSASANQRNWLIGAYADDVGSLSIRNSNVARGNPYDAGTTRMIVASNGNIGVGTIAPSASTLLDLTSTTATLLIPRMTTGQKNALTAINGMLVYDTTLAKFQGYEAGAWTNLI